MTKPVEFFIHILAGEVIHQHTDADGSLLVKFLPNRVDRHVWLTAEAIYQLMSQFSPTEFSVEDVSHCLMGGADLLLLDHTNPETPLASLIPHGEFTKERRETP